MRCCQSKQKQNQYNSGIPPIVNKLAKDPTFKMFSRKEIFRFYMQFQHLTKRDDYLYKEDFYDMLTSIYTSKKISDRIFTIIDNNKSGSIDFQEFMYYMVFLFTDSKSDKAEFIFKFIDIDNTQYITKQNLIEFYRIIDNNEEETEYDSVQEQQLALLVLSKFNKKSSEFVSLDEFKNYYCKHYKEALSLFNFLSVDAATNRELQVSKYSSNQILKQLVKIEFDLFYLEKKLYPEKQEASFQYFNRKGCIQQFQDKADTIYQTEINKIQKQKSQKIFDSMIPNYKKPQQDEQKVFFQQQSIQQDFSKDFSIERILQKIKKEVQQAKKLVLQENKDLFLKKNFVYQIEENFSRKQSKRASLVFFQNTNWNLATTLVQGIAKGLKIIEDDRDHQLSKNDFHYSNKIQFDCIFSKEFNSCKFKDYQPYVFQKIRKQCGIRDEEYVKSIGVNTFKNAFFEKLNFFFTEQSSGKSGSFFFHTFDGKYLIKTIKKSEFKVLKESLKEYFYYLQDNPCTLLPKYYGLHRIKCYQKQKLTHEVFVAVCQNVFDTTRPDDITDIYDLKGSKQGRFTFEDSYKNGAAKKDLNFIQEKKIIFLNHKKRESLLEQLQSDTKFLSKLNLIDYSILLGIQQNPDMNKPCNKHDQILDKKNNRKFFLGIIDALTDFGLTKTGEYIAKRIVHGKKMSCVPPDYYQQRFMNFMTKIIQEKPNGGQVNQLLIILQFGSMCDFQKENLVLNRLFKIEYELTGKSDMNQPKTEAQVILEKLKFEISKIKNYISQEREFQREKISSQVRKNLEIKQSLQNSKQLLFDLKEVQKRDQKQNYDQIIKQNQEILNSLEELIQNQTDSQSIKNEFKNIKFESKNQGKNIRDLEMNEQDLKLIQKWNQKDQEIDEVLKNINKNLDILDQKLDINEEHLQKNSQLIQNTNQKVTKLDQQFQTQNQKLKDLIIQMRSPSSVCMDVCLIVLILVLISILIKQISNFQLTILKFIIQIVMYLINQNIHYLEN